MKVKKKLDSEENREYWAFVEETSKDVQESFPTWKRGDRKSNGSSTAPQDNKTNTPGNSSQSSGGFHFS